MINLSWYSDQELEELNKQIIKEQRRREKEDFPYKVGDCFINCKNCEIHICLIEEIDTSVKTKNLYIDKTLKASTYETHYSFGFFQEEWKKSMDPKVFELFSTNNKAISALKSEFAKQIINLRNEWRKD